MIVKVAVVLFVIAVGIGYVRLAQLDRGAGHRAACCRRNACCPDLVKEYLRRPEAGDGSGSPGCRLASRHWNGSWPPATG